MSQGKLTDAFVFLDANVRLYEVMTAKGCALKAEIEWPRGRQRKRHLHNFGLREGMTKGMVKVLLPGIIKRIQATYGKRECPLLSKAIEEFCTGHGATVKPVTLTWYRRGLDKVLEGIGDRPVNEITLGMLEQYKSQHAATPSATNNSLHVLHALFEMAIRFGYCDRNPVHGLKLLKSRPSRARMFSEQERTGLLESAADDPSPYIRDFILWQLHTAMRPSESMSLRESAIDLNNNRVRLGVTKSNRPRYVPLIKPAQEVAWRLFHGDGGALFRGTSGRALSLVTVRAIFLRVARRAGVDVRLYDCRHDALSRAAAGGATIADLKNLAGHSTLAMVCRYLHYGPHHFDSTIAAMERGTVLANLIGDDPVTTAQTAQEDGSTQVSQSKGELVGAGSGAACYSMT